MEVAATTRASTCYQVFASWLERVMSKRAAMSSSKFFSGESKATAAATSILSFELMT